MRLKHLSLPSVRAETNAWAPLRIGVYRALWTASLVSNLGTWMQNVAGSWLMTSLSSSPAMVALMQTATSLPVLLLGVPAATLGDLFDRRKLLLFAQLWALSAAAALAAFTYSGQMSAWSLLGLTFAIGLGAALGAPLWQAVVAELVPRRELPAAVALSGVSVNLARALGPALAGLLFAAAGPALVFVLNALSFIGVSLVLWSWKREVRERSLPVEPFVHAIAAGFRFTRYSSELRTVLLRAFAFVVFASALWALLPVVARSRAGMGASGYGALLGCLGSGALAGALLLPRIRQRFDIDRSLTLATCVFAFASLVLGWSTQALVLGGALFVAGIAWITFMSSMNVSAQWSAPSWVQGRALGLYMFVFQGGMAIASAFWGVLAEQMGLTLALSAAALALLSTLVLGSKFRLAGIAQQELEPAHHWPEPHVVLDFDPHKRPVHVQIEYRVEDHLASRFLQSIRELGRVRRRDGATHWTVLRDVGDPERFVESFYHPSWDDHLRLHSRMLTRDLEIEDKVRAFHRPGFELRVVHLVDAFER